MILTRTPLRCSLLGGGSDYPAHFAHHGGAVLGMAIDKYVYVGVKRVPPGQLMADKETGEPVPIRFRVQYSKVDDCQTADEIRHPAVRAAIRYLGLENDRLEFTTFADLPGRAGLGGSSSFVVGCLHALLRLKGERPSPADLGREAIAFEQFAVREAVGMQDQIFAAFGGLNYVTFGAQSSARAVDIPPERITEMENSLVLVYTGAMRDAHIIAAKQIEAIDQNADDLEWLALLAERGETLLRSRAHIIGLGALLDHAWLYKRRFADVTSEDIDGLYRRGRRLGASGGKLLGAGGGGFMLFQVSPAERAEFEARINAPCVRFKVAQEGSRVLIDEL